jgi:hypothetical protein
MYELTNDERMYLGLEPVESGWDRVEINAESIVYFEGNRIKRLIRSSGGEYRESRYDEPTRDRVAILPRTAKGKEKKLTSNNLGLIKPLGVYFYACARGILTIASYTTQTTFYGSYWENGYGKEAKYDIADMVSEFVKNSPKSHLDEINNFKNQKLKHVKYRSGDYFCFKLNRTEYGFGRLLLDLSKAKKLLPDRHGLKSIMGKPLLVQFFAFKLPTKNIDMATLDKQTKLPSDIMMDNHLFYGEYEIIGHKEIEEGEFEFPVSYGAASVQGERYVFLQWGLIHKELSEKKFNKFIGDGLYRDPFDYCAVGFEPNYNANSVVKAVENNGVFDFGKCATAFYASRDLRNPENKAIKAEIFKAFGLDPDKSYQENANLTGTVSVRALLKNIYS